MRLEEKENEIIRSVTSLTLKGLISPLSGGCISIREGNDLIITPEEFNPFIITEKDLAVININTGKIKGSNVPNRDYRFHLLTYRKRKDVNAIVFGTPTYTTFFASSDSIPCTDIFVQAWKELGSLKKTLYANYGTTILSDRVSTELEDATALLIENYGAVTVGSTLISACYRIDILEKISMMTAMMKTPTPNHLNLRQKMEIGRLK